MKQIAAGTNTGLDLTSAQYINLVDTTNNYVNATTKPMRCRIMTRFTSGVANGSTITVKVQLGQTPVSSKSILNLTTNVTTDSANNNVWLSDDVFILESGTMFDSIRVQMISDGGADNDVDLVTYIYDIDGFDENNRVDVAAVGGATPITVADIADGVLDELVADHSVSGSLSAILDWVRDVLEADWKIDTGTTPYNLVGYIKDTSTELIRKNLKDVNGVDLASAGTIAGQALES